MGFTRIIWVSPQHLSKVEISTFEKCIRILNLSRKMLNNFSGIQLSLQYTEPFSRKLPHLNVK
ncbi:hypothetical protein NCCP2331_35940 [Sporosarcina sp. NCCP-2331]|nr:hypothetical protein NCCP2331_35940 [Sporosarcina sp. NCCP-2331]GLB57806.1 hypothetical protein NCCP2378_35980 [Sporosarcina sp. NCCP-2378]